MKKRLKLSLLDTVKTNHKAREYTFILDHNSNSNEKKKIKREICNLFDSLNKNLSCKLDEISRISNITPALIKVQPTSPSWPLYNENLQIFIENIADSSNLRIVINFEQVDSNQLIDTISKNEKISHLIEISLNEPNTNNLNETIFSTASIYTSTPNKVRKIVEDIMLDVAMYYTFINKKDAIDFNFRKNFSKTKIDYVKKMCLQSEDWNVDQNKNYLALAGYFNKKNGFDYIGYLNAWKDISENIIEPNIPSFNENIVEQLKKHKDFGELPLRKIIKLYSELNPDTYVLARLFRIPNKEKTKETIKSIFGGKTLRRGKVRFFKLENAYKLNDLGEYINLFKIYKYE